MLYALSPSELARLQSASKQAEFAGAEVVIAIYRTDPGAVARILPPPLKPTRESTAAAFIARYPQTNFGSVYNEGALFVQARLGAEVGWYCLAMPVDDDTAMIGGREQFGFPKKLADRITLEASGSQVVGRVERKGCEILRIEVEPSAALAPHDLSAFGPEAVDENGHYCIAVVSFLFKHFPSPDYTRFDYLPRIVRQVTLFRPRSDVRKGTGRVVVTSSPCDPLGEVPVESLVACFHGTWDNTMLPGKVVGRAWNVGRFLPHAFFKTDAIAFLLGSTEGKTPQDANPTQRRH
jgi:acetoacetate decarboxylase